MSELPQRLIDQKLRADLKEQIEEIKKHWPFFESSGMAIGKALQKIRQEKLYRLDHKDFESFCRTVFGFGKSRAYRVMHEADPEPINYLTGAQSSTKSGSQATNGVANSSAQNNATSSTGTTSTSSTSAPPEDLVKDEIGHIVPKALLETFAIVKRFKGMDSLCRSLQKELDEVSRIPGGEQLRMQLQATESGDKKTINKCKELGEVKRHLKYTRPHSICPWCKGEKEKGCKGCKGNGWVAKITWDQAEDAVKARLA